MLRFRLFFDFDIFFSPFWFDEGMLLVFLMVLCICVMSVIFFFWKFNYVIYCLQGV